MKKIRFVCLVIALILCMQFFAFAAGSRSGFVFDYSNALSAAKCDSLSQKAADLGSKYGCGIYVLVSDDYTGDIYKAAYTFYHDYELGLGSERNGIILLLSPYYREFAFFVYGSDAGYAFNDYAQTVVEDSFYSDFADNDWSGGIDDFIDACKKALSAAESGSPLRKKAGFEYGIAYVIAALIALIVCLVCARGMKSAKKRTEAHEYIAANGIDVSFSNDKFLYQTVSVHHVNNSSSSRPTSSRSGGGGSGRSGRF